MGLPTTWTHAVQCNNCPRPQFITVITFAALTCTLAKITEISSRVGRSVLVISGCRLGAFLEFPPSLVVTLEISFTAIFVCIVTHSRYRGCRITLNNFRGPCTVVIFALRNIARCEQHFAWILISWSCFDFLAIVERSCHSNQKWSSFSLRLS